MSKICIERSSDCSYHEPDAELIFAKSLCVKDKEWKVRVIPAIFTSVTNKVYEMEKKIGSCYTLFQFYISGCL